MQPPPHILPILGFLLCACPAKIMSSTDTDMVKTETSAQTESNAESNAQDPTTLAFSSRNVDTSTSTLEASGTDSSSPGSNSAPTDDTMGGGPTPECNVWLQDCPEGQKCYLLDLLADDAACVEVVPGPAAAGMACQVLSDVDTCDKWSRCELIDESSGLGTCLPICTGTPDNLTCPDSLQCELFDEVNHNALHCVLLCDPLASDCPIGGACLPWLNGFACLDNPQPYVEVGLPCAGDECNDGLVCAEGAFLSCEANCCTPYCDVNAAEPCPDLMQQCVSYYGGAFPEWDHVGYCTVL